MIVNYPSCLFFGKETRRSYYMDGQRFFLERRITVLVTTSYEPSEQLLARAERIAGELDGRLVDRRQYSLPKLRAKYRDEDVMLVNDRELRYQTGNEGPLVYFHPSNGFVRVKRLRKGERDLLLDLAGVKPGDVILDCTAGLASDAIVFAYAAGAEGSVTAVESSKPLACLLREGLTVYSTCIPEADEAMRRVRIEEADHLDYLRSLPDRSVDVVYFDPMFRRPHEDSSSMMPLRSVADARALSPDSIAEARRVSRRCVILKENSGSGEFERLGFARNERANAKITFGVIEI